MLRFNRIVESNLSDGRLTFSSFGQTESQASRRVLFLNYPATISTDRVMSVEESDAIHDVKLVSEGMLTNKYAITVNIDKL